MSSTPEAKPDLADARRTPFGSITRADAPPTATIPDAVRRCRWISVDLGAEQFSLFFCGPAAETNRLVPGFDIDYPAFSMTTRRLAEAARSDLAAQAARSSVPRWWSADPDTESAQRFGAVPQIEEVAAPIPGAAGLAFPVHSDRGQSGLVVFFGNAMHLDPTGLFELHGRCYALFAAVTRIRPAGSMPPLTRREQECLMLTANGYTSDGIASLLKLSAHTTNQYLANSAQKLNAVNRMHAVAKALRLGIIE